MRVRTAIVALVCVPLALSTLAADTGGIREVSASARTVIPLQTKLRYTTMVVLPDDEEILDVVCGDKDFWVISATQNIAPSPNIPRVPGSGTPAAANVFETFHPAPFGSKITFDPSKVLRAKAITDAFA